MTDGALLQSFLDRGDPTAFEALVRKHGTMVLAVGLKVVGNLHDAEDVFQATFLVLARKAATVTPRDQVKNWLLGVAWRTALKLRVLLARKSSRERQVPTMPERPVMPSGLSPEILESLEQELAHLPEVYRLPVILCCLDGKTQKEAAAELGWPEGTLAVRLMKGKKKLAARLQGQGVVLSGLAFAFAASQEILAECVPSDLLTISTVKAGSLLAAGNSAYVEWVSPHAISLAEGVQTSMFVGKFNFAAVLALTAVVASVGVGGWFLHASDAAERFKPLFQTEAEQDRLQTHRNVGIAGNANGAAIALLDPEPLPENGAEPPSITLEFYRAESESAAGLREATVPKVNTKIYLHKTPSLGNDDIAEVKAAVDGTGFTSLSIQFTAEGAKKLAALSELQKRKPLAFVVNGKLFMAPIIRTRLSDGLTLQGNLAQQDVDRIVAGFKAYRKPVPSKPAPKVAPPANQQPLSARIPDDFKRDYRLANAEVIRHIPLPFPPSRMKMYRSVLSEQAGEIQAPTALFVRWTGNEITFEASFGAFDEGTRIDDLVTRLLGLAPGNLRGDKKLRDRFVTGDFVYRTNAPRKEILAGLQSILSAALKSPITLKEESIEQEVFVAQGDFQLSDLAKQRRAIIIPAAWVGTASTVEEAVDIGRKNLLPQEDWNGLLRWLERAAHAHIVSEVKQPPVTRIQLATILRRDARENLSAEAVLQSFSEQTGLKFTKQNRPIPVVTIEAKAP